MNRLINVLIRTRGNQLPWALHVAPADARGRAQTIDYLRAVVPLNVLGVLFGGGMTLWLCLPQYHWRHFVELLFVAWLLISSIVVLQQARAVAVLHRLERGECNDART